ncbi:arylsulfotransferase family protein [Paralimibaculum aggregatum]|uniref:Arylsulfotransferase family protein n=1 Tax=Paralimibaculum aggregatum TaxID=3036245 RepID=A0ABQ6LIE2_9RHOB|nr:arylsulfotransferase family protein [Limibaculum sp. NKW23]GMG83058.1 arylsulfotransferase family protein [Limibaculum sp. NKW23]
MIRWLSAGLFVCAIAVAAFGYGVLAHKDDLFPVPLMREVQRDLRALVVNDLALDTVRHAAPVETLLPDRLAPGLLAISGADTDFHPVVRVVDRKGAVVQRWRPDWFALFDDIAFVPEARRPKAAPNAYPHGLAVLPDGGIVLNFEHLATAAYDACGGLRWALPNLGHHSVHVTETGEIWVAAEVYHDADPVPYANHRAPLRAWTAQRISADGQVLETIDIIALLERLGLRGLLHLSTQMQRETEVTGDTLHLNDVETFPEGLASGIFTPGDLMLSLRNINTVLVLDRETGAVLFQSTGQVLRHHDPDFVAGDRISVFDNNNTLPAREPVPASRVVEIDARTGALTEVLSGAPGAAAGGEPFFTDIMGSHQRLANGNILVASGAEGRLLEFLADGRLAWRYSNRISEDRNGWIYDALLLPPDMDAGFFEEARAACGG